MPDLTYTLTAVTDETYTPAIGDEVVHKTHHRIVMVVIEDDDSGAIGCRWMDTKGNVRYETFLAAELIPKPGPVGPIVA